MKENNIILSTDSYKLSHWAMYPPELEYLTSYLELRLKIVTTIKKYDYLLFRFINFFSVTYFNNQDNFCFQLKNDSIMSYPHPAAAF